MLRTEFETVKIAADSVKFYCRLGVKLGLPIQNLLNWTVFINLETEPFGEIKEYCYKFTAPLFLVGYVWDVLLGKNEPIV